MRTRRWVRLVPLFVAIVAGCGEEPARPRDPTLRGTLARMQEAGLGVAEARAPSTPDEDQKARLGKAAGLANELVGAGIRTDFPTETKWADLQGHRLVLERFADAEKAARIAGQRQRAEAGRPDAGRLVVLQAGDKLVTIEGRGAPAGAGVPGQRARPTEAPDPARVDELRAFLEADEAE